MIICHTKSGKREFQNAIELSLFIVSTEHDSSIEIHREAGPAIYADSSGLNSSLLDSYWLNGNRYTKEDWEIELFKLKMKLI